MPFNFNNYRSIPSSIKLNGPVLAYTRQPTDAIQTSDKTVVFNATVESSFIGTGEVAEGVYTFKWYLNDVELSESGSDVSVLNNGGFSQLTLSNVGFSFNGNEVYVISSYDPASNEGALNNPNLKSNVVTITAFDELEIITQPQDFVGAEKLTANFAVGARILPTTSPQNISYQWQMNNRDLFDGLISGGDLANYGITQVPVAQVTPAFQVTADDGTESFTIDWSSVSSYKKFTPGKTYTIVPNTTINTKIFAQGAGGGRAGGKNVIGSAGGIASGYATFNESQIYKLQVGAPGEGGTRTYPSSTVNHDFNETQLRTRSLTSSSDITVEAMNQEAYRTNETRTVTTRTRRSRIRSRNVDTRGMTQRQAINAQREANFKTTTRVVRVPVPADCSVNYGYRYYKITFSTPMSDDQYNVNVDPIVVTTSAGNREGIFTVAGIADKTKEGFNIWFCHSNPNTGESYADYISSFSFSLVGMRDDTTQDGEGGIPGGGGNDLPEGITINQAGGGGGYTGLFLSSVTQSNTMIVAGGGGGSSSSLSVGGNGGLILNAGETSSSGSSASELDDVVGGELQAVYTKPGTYSWIAPDGVTSVSVVCVGGGADRGTDGGGGGGLGYKNNIPVVPGNSYTVRVGDRGLNSFFISASTVKGGGGSVTSGGDFVGDGGGNGGAGGIGNRNREGGGGAGGYSGNGGNGSNGNDRNDDSLGFPGSGGGGGGGGGWFAGGGGGVGLLGEGDSGVGGDGSSNSTDNGGGGGSNGQKGTAYNQSKNVTGQSTTGGGLYGGGGGKSRGNTRGGTGAVRIMWGTNRAYPSTNVADQYASFNMTGSGGTSSAGGVGGSIGSDKGDDGSALVGGNGSDGAGGGGAGYFGGGGGGGTLVDNAVCISVIDESSPAKSVTASDWDSFRSVYPNRPFWLLKPTGRPENSLRIPDAYNTDPNANAQQIVNRDNGVANEASDWFTMCNLSQAATGTSISLAIDNSGSMRISQVQASIDLFLQKCGAAGLKVYQVTMDPKERWVVPHNKELPERKIGGGGGGSSFISSTLMTPNDVNITTKDYSSNVEGNGSLNISFIGADPQQPELISVAVSGANSPLLSLYSEQGGIGSNVRCTLSSQTAFNSPLYSETASYKVIDIRPILVIEAIDAINGWIKSTKTNLETASQVVLTSGTFGSTYKIIQFYSEESDFNLDIDIKAAAGASTTGGSGGQGGTSKIRVNIKKDVEYTMIGLAENSAIFLYEKARLIAVIGQGGDAGESGAGGAGGGVNVDGITGRGTRPGKGGTRPVSGSLTSAGIYGSTVDEDTIELYPEDNVASDQSGGRTVSCTKGLIYIDEGISPCQDVSSEKVRFLDEDGTQYLQSSLLFRGFKAGYSVTETAGSGLIGSTRSGGDGGNGATGGDGGTTNSGGGGGSGYVDDSVTVINTTSGGNPDQFSIVTFSISPV